MAHENENRINEYLNARRGSQLCDPSIIHQLYVGNGTMVTLSVDDIRTVMRELNELKVNVATVADGLMKSLK